MGIKLSSKKKKAISFFFVNSSSKGLIGKHLALWELFLQKTKCAPTLINYKNFLIEAGEEIISLNEGNKMI